MDNTFVEAMEKICVNGMKPIEINGDHYSINRLHRVKKEIDTVDTLCLNTLTGFVDYIKTNIDCLEIKNTIIHIVNNMLVSLKSFLIEDKTRQNYISSTISTQRNNRCIDSWLSQEEFIINLNSLFIDSVEKAELLQFVSKIVISDESETIDNGISQNVSVKKGLSGAITEKQETKSKIKLRPYRTFLEVEQPESEFLFRMKEKNKEPVFTLIESDGQQWQLEAMQNIKGYLREQLGDEITILC